jgi:hypothetical protein
VSYEIESKRIMDTVDKLAGACKWKPDTQTKGRLLEVLICDFLRENVLTGSNLSVATGCISHSSLKNKQDTLRQIDLMVFDNRKSESILFREGDFAILKPDVVNMLISVKMNLDGDMVKKERGAFSQLMREHSGSLTLVFFSFYVEPVSDITIENWIPRTEKERVHVLYLRKGSTRLSESTRGKDLPTNLRALDELCDILQSSIDTSS